jgi:hypothetical protein
MDVRRRYKLEQGGERYPQIRGSNDSNHIMQMQMKELLYVLQMQMRELLYVTVHIRYSFGSCERGWEQCWSWS